MSLLLASAVGAGALALAGARGSSSVGAAPKPGVATIAVRYTSTGVYGDIKDIGDIVAVPGMIVAATEDIDLQGVPCRWLQMRNGGVYKTYNMHYPSVATVNSAQN